MSLSSHEILQPLQNACFVLIQLLAVTACVLQSASSKHDETVVEHLGGFKGLLHSAAPRGRVKGLPWMLKTLVGVYADYLIQWHHIARDGKAGQYASFCHFVHQWHVSKFGLRHVAERNLTDLVLTVRHYVATSHKAQVFGTLARLLPGVEHESSTEHADFYVFMLRALAGRKPIQTLFSADDTDKLGAVRVPLP